MGGRLIWDPSLARRLFLVFPKSVMQGMEFFSKAGMGKKRYAR